MQMKTDNCIGSHVTNQCTCAFSKNWRARALLVAIVYLLVISALWCELVKWLVHNSTQYKDC